MIFDVSASGLEAQRIRMNIIANNIANAQTTRTEEGGAYRRRAAVFEAIGGTKSRFSKLLEGAREDEALGGGVRVSEIVEANDSEAFMDVYDPTHPDADSKGIVHKPNIRVVDEMVNLIDASRAYEANVTAMNSIKQIASKTLEIGRAS
jgi:flagellar basal-body rod protein FlgC